MGDSSDWPPPPPPPPRATTRLSMFHISLLACATRINILYVGAACHPQLRVRGVANRLRRRPCFRVRIDAVDFVSQ